MSTPHKDTALPAEPRGGGNRLHERRLVQHQLHLCWGNQILRARALDVSRFGILVETERAITPGTVVSVQSSSTMLGRACVRHCTPKGMKYRIGLRMSDRMIRNL